jgi:chloramphenicol 3-O-phosphotransferase
LSPARKTWLASRSVALKVMADNGADVYINGKKFLSDAASNHDALYWNNQVNVAGTNTAFITGKTPRPSVSLGLGMWKIVIAE